MMPEAASTEPVTSFEPLRTLDVFAGCGGN